MVSLAGLSNVGGGFLSAQEQDLAAQLQRQKMMEFQLGRAGDAAAGNFIKSFGVDQYGGGQPPQGGGVSPPMASPSPGGASPPPTQQPGGTQFASFQPGPTSQFDPRGLVPFIQQEAQKYGIDPQTAVRVASSEGLRGFQSGIPGEKSFGAFQLHTGGGMGDDFRRDTGLDPADPKNERATIDYALRNAAQGGWGPFHGARNTGIGQWQGINRGQSPGGPQGGMQGGMQPQQLSPQQQMAGGPQLDLQSAIQGIQRANPGAPPEVLMRALTRLAPLLNQDARIQMMYMLQMYRQQEMDMRQQRAEEGKTTRQETAEEGKTTRQQTSEEGKTTRQQTSEEGKTTRQQTSEEGKATRQEKGFEHAEKMQKGSSAFQTHEERKSNAKSIADGIESGQQPPVLSGLYGASSYVRKELEDRNFDLTKATQQWEGAKKQIATLNGPQMTRFVGLAKAVDNTMDEVNNLAKQMDMSGIPKLNALELKAYQETQGNTPNGQLVARYLGAVNTLKEEFANLANGGYAPTDAAWKLANQQINANYGVDQLGASLTELQRLIRYRLNAIPNLSTLGPGAANQYTGQKPAGGGDAVPEKKAAVEPGSRGPLPDTALLALQKGLAEGKKVDVDKLIEDGWKLTPEQDRALRLNMLKPTSPQNPNTGLPVTDSLGTRG